MTDTKSYLRDRAKVLHNDLRVPECTDHQAETRIFSRLHHAYYQGWKKACAVLGVLWAVWSIAMGIAVWLWR